MTLVIDGSYGEGGGQILRTSLSIAALTQRHVVIERIRAKRAKPGLAAQHLTAVNAVASLCDAELEGASLGSRRHELRPRAAIRTGHYDVDVTKTPQGGSAGAITLVLQTILLPLALTEGRSTIDLHGGTHAAHSPPYEAIEDAWIPLLHDMDVSAQTEMRVRGWYPVGLGHVRATIDGRAKALSPLRREHRGELQSIRGHAVTSRLPKHIGERMASHARDSLATKDLRAEIAPIEAEAACPGAGIFLTAIYANTRATFHALGERGKRAEVVADEAVSALLAFHASGATLDVHLADQALLPAALASGESTFIAERATEHLRTNAWVLERFGLAHVDIEGNSIRVSTAK